LCDQFSSWFIFLLLLALPTFKESINSNMSMTSSCLFLCLQSNYMPDLNNLTSCVACLVLRKWQGLNSSQIRCHLIWHLTHSYSNPATVNISGCAIPLADHTRILGVALDKNLSNDNDINSVSKSVHHHIHALRHIRSSISKDLAKMLACVVIGSCLNYASSVLHGTTKRNISELHKAQNLLACVVTSSLQSGSHTVLQQLQWFPVNTALTSR